MKYILKFINDLIKLNIKNIVNFTNYLYIKSSLKLIYMKKHKRKKNMKINYKLYIQKWKERTEARCVVLENHILNLIKFKIGNYKYVLFILYIYI